MQNLAKKVRVKAGLIDHLLEIADMDGRHYAIAKAEGIQRELLEMMAITGESGDESQLQHMVWELDAVKDILTF